MRTQNAIKSLNPVHSELRRVLASVNNLLRLFNARVEPKSGGSVAKDNAAMAKTMAPVAG